MPASRLGRHARLLLLPRPTRTTHESFSPGCVVEAEDDQGGGDDLGDENRVSGDVFEITGALVVLLT